jgi:hypothetical protein
MADKVWTDPLQVIGQLPPGAALYARQRLDAGAWEVVWLVREESARIDRFGPHPAVEFRAGVIQQDTVLLIPVLLRIGSSAPLSLYETWINAYDPQGFEALGDLAIQPRLVVHLFGDTRQRERSLAVPNRRHAFFRQAIAQVQATAPWDMAAFDVAREALLRQYPTVEALWQALACQSHGAD